jgi:hypothetical protein
MSVAAVACVYTSYPVHLTMVGPEVEKLYGNHNSVIGLRFSMIWETKVDHAKPFIEVFVHLEDIACFAKDMFERSGSPGR